VLLVGDDLENDYVGAIGAGLQALLLTKSMDLRGEKNCISSLNELLAAES
jgi:FMN phosphatase YigB (HAD superfamily)